MKFIALAISTAFILLGTWKAQAAPAEIFIIRHAEKDDHGPDLSKKGYKRAQRLVGLFTNSPILKHGPICAIYAAGPRKAGSSVRPVETVTPLAQALRLPIHSEFTRDEFVNIATAIYSSHECDGRSILIAWVHDEIPGLATALGVFNAPKNWPDGVYDYVWAITYKSTPQLSFIPQGF